MNNPILSNYLHTVDVVVMRYVGKKSQDGNDQSQNRIEVLLHQRENDPFAGSWALPGLVVNGDIPDTSIEEAVGRLMTSHKVAMEPLYIEQVGTEGNAFRDPRCWSSTTFYLAMVASDTQPGPRQRFVPLNDLVDGRVKLPFDHNRLCELVAERLYSKSLYSSLPMLLLGPELTLTEAVEVVSCAINRPVTKSSMHARIATLINEGYLQETGEKRAQPMGPRQLIIRNLRPGQVFFFSRCLEK